MANPRIETIADLVYYSYANLAMAHAAVEKGQKKYNSLSYIIKAKVFRELKEGTIKIRTLFDDEKIKLQTGKVCNYCGSKNNLSMDHIFPKMLGGSDDAENLILACNACNSSKGKKDLLEWMYYKGDQFLPLLIIRRYLKLVYNYCAENNLLYRKISELKGLKLPFRIDLIPFDYPDPDELILYIKGGK